MGAFFSMLMARLGANGDRAVLEQTTEADCDCSCCSTVQECHNNDETELRDTNSEDYHSEDSLSRYTAVTLEPRDSLKTNISI